MAPSIGEPAGFSAHSSFDIVSKYNQLLTTDATVTMPIAAILALLASLESHPTTTAAETLDYLSTQVATLKASQPNALSLSAGTDLFQRYIVWAMERAGGTSDFTLVRARLLANGAQLAETARKSRDMVAMVGCRLLRDESTVLTVGGSRVVGALLRKAARSEKGQVRFRVLYALPEMTGAKSEGSDIVKSLKESGIPTATIPLAAAAHVMGERRVDLVIVGAESVVENGGIVSRMGTSLVAWAAKERNIPFYVAAESQKFVRKYPNDTYEVPIPQSVVKYECVEDGKMEEIDDIKPLGPDSHPVTDPKDFVDYTVSTYISLLDIADSGQAPKVHYWNCHREWVNHAQCG
jgi:translation initiation factor eIF-2B subunit alpha